MRSLLFVPADDDRKLNKAAATGADALILDLEDSVAPINKGAARDGALAFLKAAGRPDERSQPCLVRINGLSTELCEGDLDTVMTGAPDGILLPKCRGGDDISSLHAKIAVREALHDLTPGQTRILALATETPDSLFGLGTYAKASQRLSGLAWGCEDLGAALGAAETRDDQGNWYEPYRLARNLCLIGARAAGVDPIDGVHADFRNLDGLRREAEAAFRDGFVAKLAIHPGQIAIINECFTPSAQVVEQAKRIRDAFAAAPGAGVLQIDGQMVDQPHLSAALRLLERAGPDSNSDP